jgi:hypothetical protein
MIGVGAHEVFDREYYAGLRGSGRIANGEKAL